MMMMMMMNEKQTNSKLIIPPYITYDGIIKDGQTTIDREYTVKPFNVAALKVGDFACKITLAPFILAN